MELIIYITQCDHITVQYKGQKKKKKKIPLKLFSYIEWIKFWYDLEKKERKAKKKKDRENILGSIKITSWKKKSVLFLYLTWDSKLLKF